MSFIQVLVTVLLSILVVVSAAEEKTKLKILSFGGNGMIGTETLKSLIETGDYDITLVSRGSWPFDTETLIKPHVRHVECDRAAGISTCKELMADIEATDQYYAVLDFSCFEPEWMRDAVKALQGKVRVYIYASTDSVYEVSQMEDYSKTGKKTLETDAVRPEKKGEREALNEEDEYGDDKLAGEEVLAEQRAKGKGGFPFVFLRFSDVIGPRDGTDRYVVYHLWVKMQDHPRVPAVHVPDDAIEATSITYVNDAAASMIAAMNKPESWDEAYNIACKEVFNVTDSIISLGKLMGKEKVQPIRVAPMYSFYVFPSVARGPVDISKAQQKLGFEPTPMEDVFRRTIEWYDMELESNEDFRDFAYQEWADSVFDDEEEAEEVLDEIYDEISTDEL